MYFTESCFLLTFSTFCFIFLYQIMSFKLSSASKSIFPNFCLPCSLTFEQKLNVCTSNSAARYTLLAQKYSLDVRSDGLTREGGINEYGGTLSLFCPQRRTCVHIKEHKNELKKRLKKDHKQTN